MDDIQVWLRTHGEDLTQIGRNTDVAPSMVHLVAVLVLGGIADDQIITEVGAHLSGENGPGMLAGVARAVSEIRVLAATTA